MAVPPPFAYMIAFGGKAGWMPYYISIYYVALFNWKEGQELSTLLKVVI